MNLIYKGGSLFDWFWFTKPVIEQERGREIARVVIVACHDPPMSNYAYTCVIPKSTNHKFSGYQSYTIMVCLPC